MSDQDSLQFERAEFADPQAAEAACAACGSRITDTYWEVGGRVACERCRAALVEAQGQGSPPGRFLKALLFGCAGGALGAALWYVVRVVTHYELGLIAIVVGFFVGTGVRSGSGGRGGRLYQCLAVLITYAAIASTQLPDIYAAISQGAREGNPDQSVSVVLVAVLSVAYAIAAPFLGGIQNAIGILIIGIALWEAWKINRRVSAAITGPYRLAERAPSPATVA